MDDYSSLIGFASMCWAIGFITSYKIHAFKRAFEVSL